MTLLVTAGCHRLVTAGCHRLVTAGYVPPPVTAGYVPPPVTAGCTSPRYCWVYIATLLLGVSLLPCFGLSCRALVPPTVLVFSTVLSERRSSPFQQFCQFCQKVLNTTVGRPEGVCNTLTPGTGKPERRKEQF